MTGVSDPETYYDDLGYEEWERLEASLPGRLEWEGTIGYLEEYLPSNGQVLDAGGGAGRYTVWLADRGYDVTLIDPSQGQRTVARQQVIEHGHEDQVTIQKGDIRDLSFDTGRFDAVLCLGGPLSHVLDADERLTATRELERVTAPGRPVFVSVMGRLNLLTILLVTAKKLDLMPELAESGDHDAALLGNRETAFTEAHFFRASEFESLLDDAGLAIESLVGLEGLASVYTPGPLRETANQLSDEECKWIGRLVDQQREDPTVIDMSAHMLAVCRTGE